MTPFFFVACRFFSLPVFFRSFRCLFFPVSVSRDQNTNWTFSDKWTHLFGYRGIFLALCPAKHLLDVFRQIDAKYSGYGLVLSLKQETLHTNRSIWRKKWDDIYIEIIISGPSGRTTGPTRLRDEWHGLFNCFIRPHDSRNFLRPFVGKCPAITLTYGLFLFDCWTLDAFDCPWTSRDAHSVHLL